jgi:hypothetical protein
MIYPTFAMQQPVNLAESHKCQVGHSPTAAEAIHGIRVGSIPLHVPDILEVAGALGARNTTQAIAIDVTS